MELNQAIVKRIEEICAEKNGTISDFCLKGGMSPSALYDIVKGRTKSSKVSTIKRFCQGAGISMTEFFDRSYFDDFEE